MEIPKVSFNDGNQIPIIGLGTSRASDEETIEAIKDAIDVGYRHIDCAYIYGNEKQIGIGIAAKIKEGVVKRSDLFITSKLWNTYHRAGIVEHALRKTLQNLGTDYLDLYLIHWPMAFKEGDPIVNNVPQPSVFEISNYDYVDTWKAMEELKRKGLVKSIGISNFDVSQIERILEKAQIPPVVNQVECHPYLTQTRLIEFCKSRKIEIVAYSPFASPGRFDNNPKYPKLLEDARLKKIAEKYKKSPAQIVLRWHIQQNIIVIPKSVHKNRMRENLDILGFEITEEDMSIISAFNSNFRFIPFAVANNHPLYPFNEEY